MIRVVALRSTVIGALEIFSMMLPRTSTFVGPDRCGDVPSNTRTFSKSTVVGGAPCSTCTLTAQRTTNAATRAGQEAAQRKSMMSLRWLSPRHAVRDHTTGRDVCGNLL